MVNIMNNASIAILKILLGTLSTLLILLSCALLIILFGFLFQQGMPPIDMIKMSSILFLSIVVLYIICQSVKSHLYITIDNRDKNLIKYLNRD